MRALLTGLSVLVAAGTLSAAEPTQKPNIVLILTDDVGFGDVGCYGATKVKTPNIDRLAREGRRFTDVHSASAVCTPSRYALLTGEYPFRQGTEGVWRPLPRTSGLIIDPKKKTVGKVLQSAGYATACIGKWHLGFGKKVCDWNEPLRPGPLEIGFDSYFGVPVVNSSPPYVYVENDRIMGWDADDPLVPARGKPSPTPQLPEKSANVFGGAAKAHALYDDEKTGTLLTEKAVGWIKANKSRPFFLYLATTGIHHPFATAPKFRGTSECGRYGDQIHEIDWMVGEVLKTLEDQKLAEKTLVIFTSDNGGMLNQGGQAAVKVGHRLNGDLLGFKFDAWEGGHRVPFIVRWPGKVKADSVSDQMFCLVDMLATLAAISGEKLTAADGVDSHNVLPALTGTPPKPIRSQLVLAASKESHLALRDGQWLYIGARGGGGFAGRKVGDHALGGPAALAFAREDNSDIENGRFKPGSPAEQLYDLAADPRQAKNVVGDHPDIAKRMKARLAEIRKQPRTAPKP